MKKSIFGKVGAAAVVLTLVTTSLVGGTFAKYTSTVSGTAEVSVAKWAIVMKENSEALADNFQLKLKNENTNVEMAADKIAPETYGEIKLAVNGDGSEVGYTYTVKLDNKNLGGAPIKFYKTKVAGANGAAPTFSDEVTFTGTEATMTPVHVELSKVKEEQTTSIYWKWEATDDTTEGITPKTGTIGVSITAEQYIGTPTP
ncbi:hypothetical protein GPL15_26775 [Clostridium sp. MCC353]|uniref:hypothetical protein n=1 Tax=Clostridium sp. MCC353 TaxID=2592646 RepID=UPI001C039489|nr:hypothetical protein [Clostridium sp. MCC353]MBT9780076.1 hypothetical protein [Clostridium sp. MCC353]